MPAEALARTCCLAETMLGSPGDVVMHRGEAAKKMCFVVRGVLRVDLGPGSDAGQCSSSTPPSPRSPGCQAPGSSKDWGEEYIQAPAHLGGQSFFHGTAYRHEVVCITHTELLWFHRQDLDSLAAQFTEFKLYMDEYLAELEFSTRNSKDYANRLDTPTTSSSPFAGR
eukprot:gnl/TRDRNA2_/TRDRNA2_123311_c2_seq1.p1 gnl/TRDRNA2_/TRDRNA2_123311_c2~~gnl/TRDRNA2_/TRDRNA2_123311_c2_seq1.p1  ORF type:complete len:196 (-),score=31.67 gnl/TRDRNA2_/TRDRNA2_123311_c2_seq1:49-552(-)